MIVSYGRSDGSRCSDPGCKDSPRRVQMKLAVAVKRRVKQLLVQSLEINGRMLHFVVLVIEWST